jgi:hypothetical protein
MADLTVLGMALDLDDDSLLADNKVQPLCGFIVMKVLGPDGEIVYLSAATHGLKSIECLGMARYAVLKLEYGLLHEEDDDG